MSRSPKDYYPTPRGAIESFYPHLDQFSCYKFWEPACGDRRLVRFLKGKGFRIKGDDLHFGYDFLKDYTKREVVLTNPPFSLATEFVLHSLQVAKVTVMLLPLGFLASQRRAPLFQKHPLKALYVLSKRPSFTSDGKTDSTDYAWFVWCDENCESGIFHL